MKLELSLQENINKLGNIISKIIPAPYTHTSLADNLKSYGIRVAYFNSEPYNAFLFQDHKTGKLTIALNAFLDDAQTVFSMAHELGHLLINYHWSPLDGICEAKKLPTEYCGGHYNPKQLKNEYIMDNFAESYLMPGQSIKSMIVNDHRGNIPGYATINKMAYKFQVPRTRAKERFNDFTRLLKVSTNE